MGIVALALNDVKLVKITSNHYVVFTQQLNTEPYISRSSTTTREELINWWE